MKLHDIESRGMALLVRHLEDQGRMHEPSDQKTFDLKVEGRYCELKATTQPFFTLTQAQQDALVGGELAAVFVVNPKTERIDEYTAEQLKQSRCVPETKFYYYHTSLRD